MEQSNPGNQQSHAPVELGYRLFCPACGWEEGFELMSGGKTVEESNSLVKRLLKGENKEALSAFFLQHPIGLMETSLGLYHCRGCASYYAKEKYYFKDGEVGLALPSFCDACGELMGQVKRFSALPCPMCQQPLSYEKKGKGKPPVFSIIYRLEERKPPQENVVEKALDFAAKAHKGQMRKGTSLPYLLHPCEAATIVSTLTQDPAVIASALLHDVVEDTPCTMEELTREFGEKIAGLVGALSENKREQLPPAMTWKRRKTETLTQLETASLEVLQLTLGDKLSNLRSLWGDYQFLGDGLWERFHQRDPQAHAWYYRSICELLQPTLHHTSAYQEYAQLCNALFGE